MYLLTEYQRMAMEIKLRRNSEIKQSNQNENENKKKKRKPLMISVPRAIAFQKRLNRINVKTKIVS